MNKYRLYKAGIDVNEGIGRFNGRAELYEECLKKFLSDQNYDLTLQFMQEKNVEEAFKAAHSLKGVAGNLSMDSLFVATVPFVEALRNGNLEGAVILLPEVKDAYELIQGVIKEM